MSLITFGTIISFSRQSYVFLASTNEIIYLAKILPLEISRQVVISAESLSAKWDPRSNEKLRKNALYCFVMLTTDDFLNQIAHLHKPGQNIGADFEKSCDEIGLLNAKDSQHLKEEICREDSPVPNELKGLVRALS